MTYFICDGLCRSKHDKWLEEEVKKLRLEKKALDKLQKVGTNYNKVIVGIN